MNLHGIVANVISAVNPMQTAMIAVSTGYTTNADGTRVPAYAAPVAVQVQVQELTVADVTAAQGLSLQGESKKMYLSGDWNGIVRADGKGGDLITVGGQVWLVVKLLENWPDWTALLATRQIGTPA